MKQLLFIACFALAVLPLAAEVRLASGGKTDYTIVWPKKSTFDERSALRDLQRYLKKATGADFKFGDDGAHKICFGVKAPSDNVPLKRAERRVRCENGDIYLYGEGWQGNTFAVYDFLDKFFNCRWYTFYGDEYIPEKKEAVFADVNLDVNPSFTYYEYRNGNPWKIPSYDRFRRASRSFDQRENPAEPALTDGHVFAKILPPGVPLEASVQALPPPMKYFKDKKYFETNPEFFSMMGNGKRYQGFHYCFSNPELRKELIKNLDIIVKNEYKGGLARLSLALNDKGGWGQKCCYCPECEKLNEKYGNLAGSYWDFVLEAAEHFKKNYPEINLLTYGYAITKHPPTKGIETLPPNVVVQVAPLGETDFLKPYRDTPPVYNNLKEWEPFSHGRLAWWIYPTVYPRPLWTHPLVANINRLVVNIRDAHKLGVSQIFAEYGCGAASDIGFNELRAYLIATLSRDVDADVPALIKDFMEHYYGAAAPMMLKYLNELEECEKKEKNFLRWWPDHRSALSYLTPENLLRWQKDFDAMEQLTQNDPKANLHVRRARTNLDEATMSVWYKFAPGQMPDRDEMYKRYLQTLRDSATEVVKHSSPARDRRKRIERSIYWQDRAMYYHYALAGKWRPLPEEFAKLPAGSVLRTVPNINKGVLTRDVEGSATGIAVKTKMPKTAPTFILYHWEGPRDIRENFEPKFSLRQLKRGEGKYDYHYIGTTRLYPDSMISTHGLAYASAVMTGYLFDPANPEQRYDIYLSLKPEGETLWFDEMLLVKTDKPSTLVAKAPAKVEKKKPEKKGNEADDPTGNI